MKLAFRNILRHPVKNSLIGIVIILASLVYFFTGTLIQNSRDSWRQFLSTTFLGKYNITAYQNKEKDYTLAAFSLPEEFISTQIIEYLEVNGINYAKRIKAGAAVFNEETGEFAGATVTVLGVDWEEEGKYLTNLFFEKRKLYTGSCQLGCSLGGIDRRIRLGDGRQGHPVFKKILTVFRSP